jgi:hypothetical protein
VSEARSRNFVTGRPAAALVRAFDSRALRAHVALNSHVDVTSGVILRAR